MSSRKIQLAIVGIILAGTAGVEASEWTHWRGDGYSATSSETGLVSSWSPEGENLIWKAEFIGRSTPVVFDGRACANGRIGDGVDRQEVVACFDAETGSKLWEQRFNVYNTTVPFNRVGWASLVADPETGYVFAHGVAGQLHAYDREGNVVWSRFLAEEIGRLSGYGGRTQTPLIEGDQLILSFVSSNWGKHSAPRHRYFSFDKRTGAILWIATPGNFPKDMNTQSTPVVAEIGGRRQLVSGNADGWIYSLDPNTGEKLWSFQLSRRGINSTVLVVGDRVFASHSEENLDDAMMGRIVAIDGTGTGDVTKTHELWRINELAAGFPSPTYHDGVLYAVDNSANMHAIQADTGKILWDHSLGTVGKGSPVYADGKIYVTETNGHFHIIKPGKEGAEQLDVDQVHVADGRYAEIYGSPAIANGRIYFTSEGGIYCIGDKNRKRGQSPVPPVKKKREQADADVKPARIQVVPAEVLMWAGNPQTFEVRAFDAAGNALGRRDAEWTLSGTKGSLTEGRFEPAATFQAGGVTAKVGDLESTARLRVWPDLPWSEDFAGYENDKVPPHWVGAPGKFAVREIDGEKVLVKLYRPRGLLRNAVYMGPSTMSNFTIQADVQGAQVKRRRTDVGLIANGYTFDMMGNHQRLEVRSWAAEERMAQKVPYEWEMGKWYRMKLRVDVEKTRAVIRGKVWPRDQVEPEAWNIRVEDPYPIRSGSPGLLGYSPADVLYDNVKVTVND